MSISAEVPVLPPRTRRIGIPSASALSPLLALVALVVVWQLAVMVLNIPVYLIPAPTAVLHVFLADPAGFIRDALVTAYEAAAGLLLALAIGIPLAVLLERSIRAERAFYPYLVVIQVTPVVAIAPLLVVWFGTGQLPKIIVAFLICVFPIVINTLSGLKSIGEPELALMSSFAAPYVDTFRKVRVPVTLPYLFSALRIAAPACVIGAIVGEMVGSTNGLGFRIIRAQGMLDTPNMFLAIIGSALLGIVAFLIVLVLERRFLSWHVSVRSRIARAV